MTKFLTEETPAKVMALLGSALFSMAFLFAVTATNATPAGTESGINVSAYDLFSPDNVVAFLDNTSNGYSKFVNQDLIAPGVQSYAIAADNINYVADNATDELAMFIGPAQNPSVPQVAGAYITALRSE